jgi:hypothetical protein
LVLGHRSRGAGVARFAEGRIIEEDEDSFTRAEIAGLEAVDATGAVEVDIEAAARAALLAASLASNSEVGSGYGNS